MATNIDVSRAALALISFLVLVALGCGGEVREPTAGGDYALSVAPVPLSPDHPLGSLGRKQMGIVYHTDIYGTITATIEEPDPIPSAATMLRDLLDIYV